MILKQSRIRQCFSFVVVAIFVVLANLSADSAYAQRGIVPAPDIELISPRPGDVLVAGQTVRVEWRTLNADKSLNIDWCEQEIYLSVDGGSTVISRISPQLDPRATSFEWVVPNTPTKEAVLDVSMGCDGGAPYLETSRMQRSVVFRIESPRRGIETVKIAAAEGSVFNPGDEINLSWESSVEKVKNFDVMVSYDSGAHYSRVGRTKDTNFTFKVPDDFAGSLTFQIVARKPDGTSVRSLVDLRNRILVKQVE